VVVIVSYPVLITDGIKTVISRIEIRPPDHG